MHILDLLKTYHPSDPKERMDLEKTASWVAKHGNFAFVRKNLAGHVTGSLLISNTSHTAVLLMHHKKLNRWLNFGGHADGESDIERVAIREFLEESGSPVLPHSLDLFDIDAHTVPTYGKEPEHTHFDVVFFGTLEKNTPLQRQKIEVNELRWFTLEEAEMLSPRMERMMKKLRFIA